jgi:hypothetical protein
MFVGTYLGMNHVATNLLKHNKTPSPLGNLSNATKGNGRLPIPKFSNGMQT